LLESTSGAGKIESEQLRRYARLASIDIERNMREAGAAQVEGMHRQLLKCGKKSPIPNGIAFASSCAGRNSPWRKSGDCIFIGDVEKCGRRS
jgi:hypothetical protein